MRRDCRPGCACIGSGVDCTELYVDMFSHYKRRDREMFTYANQCLYADIRSVEENVEEEKKATLSEMTEESVRRLEALVNRGTDLYFQKFVMWHALASWM